MDSTNWVSFSRYGESEQAGSVTEALPVNKAAWQRQPPKSISRNSQLRHGSGIHSVPRKRLNDSESVQIHRSGFCRTFSNLKDSISPAVGHGKTSPRGLTVKWRLPHPCMHGFGRSP